MRADGDAILIAAQSGRTLAQAARRAGLRPFVLDLFGDEDTLALAEAHRTLPGRFGSSGLVGKAVLAGLDQLARLAGGRTVGVVLGSGFEGAPELMTRIALRHRLIGAEPRTVAALKDPLGFAALCARLAIPHPSVTTAALQDRGAWLCKRIGGSGGSHIRASTAGPAPLHHVFQSRVPGCAHALNVLADSRGISVLAFTRQWTAPSPLRPYRYGGAIAPGRDEAPVVAQATIDSIAAAVDRLVAATGLRGLASADVLVDGPAWWLLEINPRPGATLDVLDRRSTPLLASHIAASLGSRPALDPMPTDASGAEVCYATRAYRTIPPLDWPDFARDRPRIGSRVGRDAPLCTVTATGPSVQAVRDALHERRRAIDARLGDGDRVHGYRHQAAEHQRPDRAAGRPSGR